MPDASKGPRSFRLGLKVQAFRAFRDETAIEMRPLTLLYGRNQAGKSSLLRLLALLADSLQSGAKALDLESPALRGASFKELGWLGPEPALSPWITLSNPAISPVPRLAFQYSDENGLCVKRLRFARGTGWDKLDLSLDSDTTHDGDQLRATYAGQFAGKDWSGVLEFSRLLPKGLPDQAAKILSEVEVALEPLQHMQWLHANRLSFKSAELRRSRVCSPDGSDLANLLRDAEHRATLGQASAWLSQQDRLGEEVVIELDADGRPRFSIRAPGRSALPIHLAGEGVRALLPILLCACWADQGILRGPNLRAPSLLAVEEPEAHLHPDLQVRLMERLIETVRAGTPVVLETHSVYVLRAMQIAVLEHRLSPDDVGLYWVEQANDGAASVNAIGVNQDATLQGWRPHIFEQEQELAHKILDLRWKRLGAT